MKQAITPGKGHGHVLKNEDPRARAHQLRCEECDGVTLVSLVKPDGTPLRRSCAICGVSTASYCTGCKRHLCIDKDRSEKLKDGEFGSDPEGYYRMTQYERGDESWDKSHLFAIRSCYHIGHEDRMRERWDEKRNEPSPLDRVHGLTKPKSERTSTKSIGLWFVAIRCD